MDGISKGTWRKIDLYEVLQERNEKNVEGRTICSVSVSQGVVNQIEYLGRSFAAKQTSHYNVVKYGDIVYTKSPTGDFPYGIIKRSDIREDVAVSPLWGLYSCKWQHGRNFAFLFYATLQCLQLSSSAYTERCKEHDKHIQRKIFGKFRSSPCFWKWSQHYCRNVEKRPSKDWDREKITAIIRKRERVSVTSDVHINNWRSR